MVSPANARHARTTEHTASANQRKKEVRWRRDAQRHITAMRLYGFVLRLTHGNARGSGWCLSDGTPVEHGCAQIILKDRHVVDVGDTLFRGVTSGQTFRFAED
jgi:hypothetical protein